MANEEFALTSGRASRDVIVSLIAAALAFALIVLTIPPFLPTNDDGYIQQIMSGGVSHDTGYYYISFTGVVWTYLISRLFLINAAIPWWTLSMMVCLFIACNVINLCTMRLLGQRLALLRQGCTSAILTATSLVVIDYALSAAFVGSLHFTTTSSFLLSVAMVGMFLQAGPQKPFGRAGWIVCAALFGIGFSLRLMCGWIAVGFACLMVLGKIDLPTGGIGGVVRHLFEIVKCFLRTTFRGEGFGKCLRVIMCISLVLAAAQVWASSVPEWRESARAATPQMRFIDYPRQSYASNPGAYEAVGFDEDLAYLASSYYALDSRETPEAFIQLNEATGVSLSSLLKNPVATLKHRARELKRPAPYAWSCLLIVVALVSSAVCRRRAERLFLVAVFISSGLLVGYLLFKGRLPERAFFSVILPALAVLVASLLLRQFTDKQAKRFCESLGEGMAVRSSLTAALSVLSLLFCAITFRSLGGTAKLFCILTVLLAVVCLVWPAVAVGVGNGRPFAFLQKGVAALLLLFAFLPGVGAYREHGLRSTNLAAQLQRQENVDLFYDYVEQRPDTLYIYDTSSGLTPQNAFDMRWPANQTAWGGWRYRQAWFDRALKKAGFLGEPTTETLLNENVRLVTGSRKTDEVMLKYLTSLYGPVEMRVVDKLTDSIYVYQIVLGSSMASE